MGSYYPSFNYKGLNSLTDKNLIVAAFDADQGEVDTFLGMEPIYTENADGSLRIDYGAKFNSVAVIKISLIKVNQKDFTVAEVRDFLKWTTGVKQNSYLDLVLNGEIQFSFLGRVTNAYQQKIDARTIGLAIEFTSVSPWAYSPEQVMRFSFGQSIVIDNNGCVSKGDNQASFDIDSGGVVYDSAFGSEGTVQISNDGLIYLGTKAQLQIDNKSDDLYSYVTLDTEITNKNSTEVYIKNLTLDEETRITNISANEIIKLSSNKFISSDNTLKTFGNSFNFVWPRLAPGINELEVSGNGVAQVEFTYRYPIKIGDCAIDIIEFCSDIDGDGVCDNGVINTLHPITWDDIADKPNTLGGYGIIDAYPTSATYNKNEIDSKIKDIDSDVDSVAHLVSNISSYLEDNYYDKSDLQDNYYNKDEINGIVYTEEEINKIIEDVDFEVKSNAALISNVSSDLMNNYYRKTEIESLYYDTDEIDNLVYTKKDIDKKVKSLTFDIKSNAYLISNTSSKLENNYYDVNYINDNFYNKTEIDRIISRADTGSSDGDSIIMWSEIVDKPTTLSEYRIKSEVQDMIDKVRIDIDDIALNAMLDEIFA